jgi:hypothetical protein
MELEWRARANQNRLGVNVVKSIVLFRTSMYLVKFHEFQSREVHFVVLVVPWSNFEARTYRESMETSEDQDTAGTTASPNQ